MSFVENIRRQPKEKKIRIMWISVAVAVVALVALWIVTARIQKDVPSDTTLFQTISRGFKDLRGNYSQPIK